MGRLTAQHQQAQARNKPANENLEAYYKLAEDSERLVTVGFKLRTGRVFYLHYAYRFNVDFHAGSKIVLMVHSAQITITIEGRNLAELSGSLLHNKVVWVRETLTPNMDEGEDVFIKHITIKGKAFEKDGS